MPLMSRVKPGSSVSTTFAMDQLRWINAGSTPGRLGDEVADGDADQHGRDRIAANEVGHVLADAAEAFLFQVSAAAFERAGDRAAGVAEDAFVGHVLANRAGQRLHAAGDGRGRAFDLLANERGGITGFL